MVTENSFHSIGANVNNMSLTLTGEFFVLSILLTFDITFPAPARNFTCEVREFQESKTLVSTKARLGECIKIHNAVIPTSLQINCDDSPSSSHTLYGFSSATCNDTDVILERHLPSPHSLGSRHVNQTINERTPICSFRLHDEPFPEYPVSITFYGNESSHNYKLKTRNCTSLPCGVDSGIDPKFALSVGLYEEDGTVANNCIELFSNVSCEQPLEYSPGNSAVYSEADLVDLTNHQSQLVKLLESQLNSSVG